MLAPIRSICPAGLLLTCVTFITACNPPAAGPPGPPVEEAQPAAEPVGSSLPASAAPATPTTSTAQAAVGAPEWQSWEAGSALAREANKPMMLFVYADWCGRCRELEPVFSQPEVVEASSGLVLIRQNQDEPAPWLQTTVADSDTYVPRVIFLNPDGTRRAEVSPHPRFPLFYTPGMVGALVANMRAVAGS